MNVIETRFLRGPNLHSPRPCFVAILDLEALDEVSSADLPGFTERLCACLPTLNVHRCSTGYRGGFIDRLKEGTYMAHITEHVLLELQCLAGTEVGYGKARMIAGRPRHYTIVCSYHIEQLVKRALAVAVALVEATAHAEPFDLETPLAELITIVQQHGIGPSTRALLESAHKRHIPTFCLSEEANLFQLGWGKWQQRIQATITSKTSQIAVELASHKQLMKNLLLEDGLSVPDGEVVTTLTEAAELWQKLGKPATVKPLNGNHGRGITSHICTAAELATAFSAAQQHSHAVIVEETVPGEDYRIMVVNGRVVAAARRKPPQVIGDGKQPIESLIAAENANPARGEGHEKTLTRIPIDEHSRRVLQRQGYTLESVPAASEVVILRDNANLSTGGVSEDVTADLHPRTREECERASRRCGLDVAGIDLICNDICKPLSEQQGAIIEINAAPGIRMHEWPAIGQAQPVGQAIVEHLIPSGSNGRIPLIAVTGTNGKTTTTLLIARAYQEAGYTTGVTTTEGVFIGTRCLTSGDCTGYWSARQILSAPDVDAAVLETARGGILQRGLGFDRCDVAVILNIQNDHLGQEGVETLEDLARVKAVVARSASKAVVLNADDAHCLEMREEDIPQGAEVILFSLRPDNPAVQRHLQQNGRAVYVEHGTILVAQSGSVLPVLPAHRIPCTLEGHAQHNVANVLAAVSAWSAADLPMQYWLSALLSFQSDAEQNPLRLNRFDVGGVTVVVDYAHNPEAYRALIDTCRSCTQGRLVGIIAAPGDRRAEELQEMGAICAERFDELIVYEINDLREQPPGYAAQHLLVGIQRTPNAAPADVILNVHLAVRAGLNRCRPGDTLVLGCASESTDLSAAVEGIEITPLAA